MLSYFGIEFFWRSFLSEKDIQPSTLLKLLSIFDLFHENNYHGKLSLTIFYDGKIKSVTKFQEKFIHYKSNFAFKWKGKISSICFSFIVGNLIG